MAHSYKFGWSKLVHVFYAIFLSNITIHTQHKDWINRISNRKTKQQNKIKVGLELEKETQQSIKTTKQIKMCLELEPETQQPIKKIKNLKI